MGMFHNEAATNGHNEVQERFWMLESLPGITIGLARRSKTSSFQTRVMKFGEQVVQQLECSPQQLCVSTPYRKQHKKINGGQIAGDNCLNRIRIRRCHFHTHILQLQTLLMQD